MTTRENNNINKKKISEMGVTYILLRMKSNKSPSVCFVFI